MPHGYAETLGEIKQRIQQERLRVVMSANSAMVLLYWDIGRMILDRQEREGWGAKVIDRLSADLREAYPDMQGLSPRNLLHMRAFAAAYPDSRLVKQLVSLKRVPSAAEKAMTPIIALTDGEFHGAKRSRRACPERNRRKPFEPGRPAGGRGVALNQVDLVEPGRSG
jgi:hypothetical protein